MNSSKKSNLAYRIHHVAALLERRAEQVLQEQFEIGFSQFKILMALKWKTNVQQRHIADSLGQTEASVSRQIKMMHQQGLLESKTQPGNRRQRITSLTIKGNELADAAVKSLGQNQKIIFAGLSQTQRDELIQSLDAIHQHLCQSDTCAC